MSILSSLSRQRHLDDSALAALWTSSLAPGELDVDAGRPAQGGANHLQSCAQCRSRYDALNDWLAETRVEAVNEADEVFTPERLATQQAQVLRRLEALDRPARVIAFPRFVQPAVVARRGPQRWIAAAAAAGLIVGLGAGELRDFRRSYNRAAQNRLVGQPIVAANQDARNVIQPVSLTADDAFLYDSDDASISPRVEALQALDALTPRVRDLDQVR